VAALTCDICGGNLAMDASGDFAVCESCGMKHTKERVKAKVQGINKASAEPERTAPVVIPKKFANATLEKVKRSLVEQIDYIKKNNINCNIALGAARERVIEKQDILEDCRQKDRDHRERKRSADFSIMFSTQTVHERLMDSMISAIPADAYMDDIAKAQKDIAEARKLVSSIETEIAENGRKLITCNAQLRDLDALLQKTEIQRTEEHYQRLLAEGKSMSSRSKSLKSKIESNIIINSLTTLGKQFQEMEGYKNSGTLGKECLNLAAKIRYDDLVRQKENFDSSETASPEDYRFLAKEFRDAKGYAETEELAKKCECQAVEVQYNRLVNEKNKISTEKEYQGLAERFKAMNGYKNTTELASECDNRYRELKECRENQEMQEKKEREKREHRQAAEEKRRRFAEKMKRLFWTIFSLVLGGIIGGFVFDILVSIAHTDKSVSIWISAIILIIVFVMLFRKMIARSRSIRNLGCDAGALGCFGGVCLGVIGGIVAAYILCALLIKLPLIVSIVIGIAIGALTGRLINKKYKH
jgi:F0F1-type ATP synthase assembly protein I